MNQTFAELMKNAAAAVKREREMYDLPSAGLVAARDVERAATFERLVAALADVPSEMFTEDGTRVVVVKTLQDRLKAVDVVAGSRTPFELRDAATPGIGIRLSAGIADVVGCEVRKTAVKDRNVTCDSLLAAKKLIAREFAALGLRVPPVGRSGFSL